MKLTAYEAASDSVRWTAFLEQLRSSFGATSVCFRAPSTAGVPEKVWWIDSGTDPSTKPLYVRQWGAHDPWANHPRGHSQSGAGRCFIGSQILPWKDLLRTGFYNDFGRRAGLKGVMTALVEGDGYIGKVPQTKLALFREHGLPEFEPELLGAFRALQGSLRRALHSYWAFQSLRVQASAVEQTLETVATPVFVLRSDRTVDYANSAAKLLEVRGMVSIVSGRVVRIAQLPASPLEDLLKSAVAGIPQEVGLWTQELNGFGTAALHLTRVLPESAITGHWPRAEVLMMVQRDNAVRAKEARTQALAFRCGLTPAEVQILKRLANGEAADEVAQAQGVRLSTVRTHIRHLLEKTRSRRLVDLLRVVGG